MTTKKPAKKAPAKAGVVYGNEMRQRYRESQAHADTEYKRVSDMQKKWAYQIADDIEAGRPIKDEEKKVAAGCLRLWAEGLNGIRKLSRGKPAEFDHVALAWDYQRLLHHEKLTRNQAQKKLAEQYECSIEMVRRILKQHSKAIEEFLGYATVYWSDQTTK